LCKKIVYVEKQYYAKSWQSKETAQPLPNTQQQKKIILLVFY